MLRWSYGFVNFFRRHSSPPQVLWKILVQDAYTSFIFLCVDVLLCVSGCVLSWSCQAGLTFICVYVPQNVQVFVFEKKRFVLGVGLSLHSNLFKFSEYVWIQNMHIFTITEKGVHGSLHRWRRSNDTCLVDFSFHLVNLNLQCLYRDILRETHTA